MDTETTAIALGAALAISEGLSLIPALRANGILQLIFQIIRFVAGGKTGRGGRL
jgi:hypothetical protein